MSITELLKADEGKTLEFKQDLSSPRNLLKTLVAFANTAGGKIIIGVVDKTREPVGIDNPLDEEERLCNLIADSIAPRLVPNLELATVRGKTLLLIEVFLSNSRPHYLCSEGPETGVYVRLGTTSRQADRQLIAELRRSVEGVSFDEMPMPGLSVDDLDIKTAQKAFGTTAKLNEQALLTLKLLARHQSKAVPTKGGVLLFGRQRTQHFPDAWIQCGRFFGTEKIDIFDHIDIDVPLPEAVDEVMLFLKKHAYRGADLSEVRRKDVWSIPLGILREMIINALVHSDYSQRGAPIRVVFLDDRIEVESMGILLPGLTIEEMKQGASRIRNPVIARVFKELSLIEQWGTGVRRIFTEARELGLPEPKIEEIGLRLRFTVYLAKLHRIQAGEQKARPRVESGVESGVGSGVESKMPAQVLSFVKEKSLSKSEIAKRLGKAKPTRYLNDLIARLLREGYVEYTIPDKPNSRLQKYRLTEKGEHALEAGYEK
ncbi:MAG: helix-turn-helix domain-containing protein [Desulfurivibrio sp.]|nr:helix-turn-helix domain-containing protein [Desulfurivibrio sp.]